MDIGRHTSTTRADVEQELGRLRRRFLVRTALSYLSTALPWVLLLLVTAAAVSRVWRLDLRLSLAASVLLGAGVAASSVVALLRSPRPARLALWLDRRLETHEALTAAWEAGPSCTHPLDVEVRRRAGRILSGGRPRAAIPLTRPRAWRSTVLGAVALLLVPWIPQTWLPRTARADEREALERTGSTLARQVETLSDDAHRIEEPLAREAFEKLEKFAADLEEGRLATREEALLALEQVEKRVRSCRAQAGAAPPLEFEGVMRNLASDPLAAGLAQALRSQDEEPLRQALRQMAEAIPAERHAGEAMRERLQSLADRFDELAGLLGIEGFTDGSATLRRIANALRDGNVGLARDLLSSQLTVRACKRLGPGRNDLARDLAETLHLARYLLGLGTPPRLGEPTDGEGARDTAGPYPGGASTNEAAGGYRAGDPVVRDRSSDRMSDRTGAYDALYDSHIIEAESWVDVQAAGGQIGAEGEFRTGEGRSLGIDGDARHHTPLSATAEEGSPERAAELERIPLGYRDVVRRYFAREAPESPNEEDEE